MSRVEKVSSRIFFIFLSLLLIFTLIEVAANYYLWNIATEEQFNSYASINQLMERYGKDFLETTIPTGRYVPHQYIGFVGTPNWRDDDSNNRHNSLGYRGDEVTKEKPADVYRIVALGSSETYSTSVGDYRESYPYMLQMHLHENGYTNVEVINAGVGGYTSYESLLALQFRILELDPDLIVVYQGSNDIHARIVWPPEAYLGDNSGFRTPFVQDIQMTGIWEYSVALRIIGVELGWTISNSAIDWRRTRDAETSYSKLYLHQINFREYPSDFFEDVSVMDILDANPPIYFENNVRNMAMVANSKGIDILFSTLPLSLQFNKASINSEGYLRGHQEHDEITRQVAKSTDNYLIDLAAIFPDEMQYFSDGRHMTKEGNALRGQLIGDYIIDNIFEDDNQ
jgi:hypothetical protein